VDRKTYPETIYKLLGYQKIDDYFVFARVEDSDLIKCEGRNSFSEYERLMFEINK